MSSANTYQQLFAAGQALRGGYIVNTSDPGDEPIWVDITGATGATLGNGAMPVYPAAAAGTAPGAWRIPPTTSAVTIYGPAGATFRAVRG
ncbi:hypothetical protein [Chenggangzhangella methanolivorans]|uniref:Uncharacterized protein n=1 Tax=Chenggangzhangella methanolivorans TaxID=1437009 RepID=A0A9E6UPA4_9HYPH|nr:hypothetical protein [Chenggangzhangella methanolivorans]QZN99539.1 hypothetical protein K6K41_22985 [Chenggangzhangella methanolivorans]